MTTYTFGILTDEIVNTRYDEEGFEFVQREVYYLIGAHDQTGRNYVLTGEGLVAFSNEADAQAELAALDHDPSTNPIRWHETDPTYGSDAWGPENEYELACFEADCFNEPRPRW